MNKWTKNPNLRTDVASNKGKRATYANATLNNHMESK